MWCLCVLEVVFLSKMWQETRRRGLGLKKNSASVAAPLRWKKQREGGHAAGGAMLSRGDLPSLPRFPHLQSTVQTYRWKQLCAVPIPASLPGAARLPAGCAGVLQTPALAGSQGLLFFSS